MPPEPTSPGKASASPRFAALRQVLLEALLVAAIGAVIALAANALSPRGLKLTRDYFYRAQAAPTNSTQGLRTAVATPTNAASQLEAVAARLQQKGLTLARSNQVLKLYQDPRREQSLVVFIDARDKEHYQQGHIPGAYQFDYYHPENYLATILPLCQFAQQIAVYCNGGDCEDSELAATLLRDAGISKEKLLVYGGGMAEWSTNGWPVELGERLSGTLRGVK